MVSPEKGDRLSVVKQTKRYCVNKGWLYTIVLLSCSGYASDYAESFRASPYEASVTELAETSSMDFREGDKSLGSMEGFGLMSAAPSSAHGWYLFLDPLYWHASVGNYDWAFSKGAFDVDQIYSKTYKKSFKLSWGFRVGLGMNMWHDDWYSELYYTRFCTHNSVVLGANATFQNTATLHNAAVQPNFFRGKSKHKITFNMLDWELGRSYFISPSLAISPYIGVKGGWIDQHAKEKFSYQSIPGFSASTIKLQNDFLGVGPLVGMKSYWDLVKWSEHHFALFGNFSGALMYGHFNDEYHSAIFAPEAILANCFIINGLNRNLAVPVLRSLLGLEWHTGFNQDQTHFGLQVGYELQYWFRQNQFIYLLLRSNLSSSLARLSDDLALQGLTLDVKFDF